MLSNYVKRFQLPLFFLLSLIISWAIWIPQAATTLNDSQEVADGSSPLNLLAVWGPGLSAIFLSLLTVGKPGPRALFRQIRRWRVSIHWYLIVLLYPSAIWLTARAIDALLGQSYELALFPLATYFVEQAWMVPVAIVSALPNTLGEELGWRGFALPNLQAKYNALVSSIILGLFWGFWHVPMWIAFGTTTGMPLLVDVVTMVKPAILYTWVYNSTGGSLLLIWLFHFAMTITQYFLPPIPTLTDDILSLGLVVLIVIIAGAKHLSRKRELDQ